MKHLFILVTVIFSSKFNVHSQDSKPDTSGIEGYEVFDVVDQMPTFPGGMEAFNNYIANNIKYPELSRKKGIQGKVFVQFLIGLDGKIYKAKVIKSIEPELDEEALRVVNSSPAWSPAQQGDQAVVVKMILPIEFNYGN
ncbi:MAG: energy transducer TonB [Reichenbachiella sp.]